MMLLPNPGVLDSLIRDRQTKLRAVSARPASAAWRVRVGKALIVAGTSLSGESAEAPAGPSALTHAA